MSKKQYRTTRALLHGVTGEVKQAGEVVDAEWLAHLTPKQLEQHVTLFKTLELVEDAPAKKRGAQTADADDTPTADELQS